MSKCTKCEANAIKISGSNFAVFANGESTWDESIEQLTHWNTLESARKSKQNWHDKERHIFILARIKEGQVVSM
jgi:hypothetical protein